MANDKQLKTDKMSLLGIIVTGFTIGILLIVAVYGLAYWILESNYPDYSLDIGIGRVNYTHIYVETPTGTQASKLLDSTAPGWGCFNVSADSQEVSNYVGAGGDICSSKAGSRQYFEVHNNASVLVVGNFKDNTSEAVWAGVI